MQKPIERFRNEDGSINVNAAVMEGRKARSREAIAMRRSIFRKLHDLTASLRTNGYHRHSIR